MDSTIKLLAINTGSAEVVTEKHEFQPTQKDAIKETILECLNRMGRSSHVLISYKGKLHTAHHTAQRGPSKDYFRSEIKYHPMAEQLQ